ncbi:hypothetical protein [Haliangium sp.]|uniref:hypothetical protein n=1 Tax=Haliangium sp. TaxID=2663208 RepID=UPI003D145CB2
MSSLGPGFQFDETMSGSYTRVDGPGEPRPLSFTAHVVADSVVQHMRDGRARITGTIDAEGLATSAPIEGTMVLRPLPPQNKIGYDFRFTGDDGRPYVLRGQKDISLFALRRTLTELPAEILSAGGALVATTLVRFDLADLRSFLRSWRLRRS